MTPERIKELSALAETYNTPEAREKAGQTVLLHRLQKRIEEMEKELKEMKDELHSIHA